MQNINTNNKECMDTLFFISQAIHFTRTEGKGVINGLTEETILPFITITAIYYRFPQFNFTFSEPTLTKLLLNSIKNLNDKNSTKLNEESINFILKNLDDFELNQLISKSTAAEIITILARKLIHNNFSVDKILLLSLLFGYFLNESDEMDINVKLFVENEGKSLLDYIFNNLTELNKSIQLQKLNMSVFDKSMLTKYLLNKLNESEKTVQIFSFLKNFCLNAPEPTLLSENFTPMKKDLKDDSALEKIANKKISISADSQPEEINIDDLISNILTDTHDDQDKSTQLFNLLFEKMITDKQMFQNYLLYTIDYNCSDPIEPKEFLLLFILVYKKYQKDFIEAVNQRCTFNSEINFIIPNNDFKLNDLPIPESGIYVIDQLFKYANENKATYQLFLCLKNLACSFPFLFKNYSKQIFDLVLPNIDYFYLLFDQNANEKSIELAKIAYSSLSFLFSTLKLPNILEDFFELMNTNIFTFTNSQIISFLVILNYITNNHDFRIIMGIMINQYDFLVKLQILLDREIVEGKLFEKFYKEIICVLISKMVLRFTDMGSKLFEKIKSYCDLDHPIINFINTGIKRLPIIQICESIENEHFSKQIQDFIINTDYQREFWIAQDINRIIVKILNEYHIYSFTKELNPSSKLLNICIYFRVIVIIFTI